MKEGMPGWVQKVDVAIGIALDVGMGVADANSSLEKGLSALIAVETNVLDEVKEYI